MSTNVEPTPSVEAAHESGAAHGRSSLAAGSALRLDECERLQRIAKVIEIEANTWREGFAVRRGTVWVWSKENEWAQVRALKLDNAVEFLRGLANRYRPPKTAVSQSATSADPLKSSCQSGG